MNETVIAVENLSKQYRLGQVGTGSLSHDVNRMWYKLRGKEDPYLKIGEENDRTSKGSSDYVWALKDVGFEVKQGEVLGIIGRNGAGKSTLLKILSRTTTPTTGSIKIRGRVASLLEVGTGFHPELSGRDNIFLNGAILGMTREEVKRKFDEIVDFSGVEKYIDTPVKRYSSGMYVRLAFAVAAHLEPEILIVDEVLAVGDMEFQKKCLGKMKDVSDRYGRTVLFVSHNMEAIQSLTSNALLLNHGTVVFTGTPADAIKEYFDNNKRSIQSSFSDKKNLQIYFDEIVMAEPAIMLNDRICFRITLVADTHYQNLTLGIGITNDLDNYVGNRVMKSAINLKPGNNVFDVFLANYNLAPGNYKGAFAITRNEKYDIFDSVVGYPEFTITNDLPDTYLASKWERGWGNHILKDVEICEVTE